MSPFRFCAALAVLLATDILMAGAPVPEVQLSAGRIRLAELVPRIPPALADIDLGPVPSSGSTRLVDRAEIIRAIHEHGGQEPAHLPDAIRVVRKMKHLEAGEIEQLVREATGRTKLSRGASLGAIRAPRSADIAEGWTTTEIEIPHPPRRAGSFTTIATLVFSRDGEALGHVGVPIDLSLSKAASEPDLARGAPVTLVIQRGLVEVNASAVAGADAEIGSVFPVTLYPSGHVVRARLLENGRALAVENH